MFLVPSARARAAPSPPLRARAGSWFIHSVIHSFIHSRHGSRYYLSVLYITEDAQPRGCVPETRGRRGEDSARAEYRASHATKVFSEDAQPRGCVPETHGRRGEDSARAEYANIARAMRQKSSGVTGRPATSPAPAGPAGYPCRSRLVRRAHRASAHVRLAGFTLLGDGLMHALSSQGTAH